jgi:hypothetical protein
MGTGEMAVPVEPDVPEENDGSPARTEELLAQSRDLLSALDAQLATEREALGDQA